jgi:uncharacterized protein YjbJ (UPF0337 family)
MKARAGRSRLQVFVSGITISQEREGPRIIVSILISQSIKFSGAPASLLAAGRQDGGAPTTLENLLDAVLKGDDMWNKDEIKGKKDQVKGTVKDKVGEFTNDRDLEAEGEAERAGGNVREGFGKARRKVGEAIEDVGEKISGNR